MADKKLNAYDTIEQIVEALNPGKVGNDQIYVGKNYTKECLIRDLLRINEQKENSND